MFKKRGVFAIIVTAIVVSTTTFGFTMFLERRDYRIFLGNQYIKNLYEVMSNVEGLQTTLSKVSVTTTPEQSLLLFGEIWNQAGSAQDKLNTLPVQHASIEKTSTFLSQVADFSYTLLKVNNKGQNLTEKDYQTVETLKANAANLNNELHALEASIEHGNIDWGEIKSKGRDLFRRAGNNTVDLKFEKISKDMQQYPTLIYDGPFSENVLNVKPKVLSEAAIDLNKAKEIATNIIGKDKVQSIDVYSDKKGAKIPAFPLTLNLKAGKDKHANIDISVNGGKIIYLLNNRDIGDAKFNVKDVVKKGMEYLDSIGYKDMMPTYSLRYDNVATINYVYVQDKVVVYPDQVKLKIALDNAEIIGVEAQPYLTAHQKRDIKPAKISVEAARKNISTRIAIKNVRMTIIPVNAAREVQCYEFYGTYKGERFLVYINVEDGTQERILKILETPNGELTM